MFEDLRKRHGDGAVDAAARIMGDPMTVRLFPDLGRFYKALKGEREGLRATQVVLVGNVLRDLVTPFYHGDAQTAVYLLKAVDAIVRRDPSPPAKESPDPITKPDLATPGKDPS